MKDHSLEVLKELNKQDEATFFEYFEGLKLKEVRKKLTVYFVVFTTVPVM